MNDSAPMRVGIDYRVAVSHPPGVGRYVRELTRALVALDDPLLGLALVDIGREPDSVPASALGWSRESPRVTRLRIAVPRRAALLAGAFGQSVERFVGDLAVFHHSKAPFLPVEGAMQTLAIGDLPTDPVARAQLARSASRCARVFVFSEAAVPIVAGELDLPVERVVAVPVGADHWSRELREDAAIRLADPPRVLVLGAQTSRREPMRWLRALELLAGAGGEFDVLVAGRRDAGDPEFLAAVAESSISNRIRFDSPGEDAMPRIVAESSLMIHLDRDALTAVTPLEACAAGCAVVVSDTPVFRESLAGTARFLGDADSLADFVAEALACAHDTERRRARRERANAFTWERCARATLETWRAIR